MSVIVKYTETPARSYNYLVEVGYWNGVINLRTYSPVRKPLVINKEVTGGVPATLEQVQEIIVVMREQFTTEDYTYELIQESIDSLV